MPSRRSHNKSRLGCVSCKKRRVKCDEAGPPCGNCRARATECHYPGLEVDSYPHRTSPYAGSTTSDAISDAANGLSSLSLSRQTMELQLMHRWSTVTYRGISHQASGDSNTWQIAVPMLAFRFDFLLNGLFSVAAFDLASSGGRDSPQYVGAALEYQDIAIRSFQSQLQNAPEEAYEALLYFSIILMILSLVSGQFISANGEADSMIQNSVAHFQLVRGIGLIMEKSQQNIADHPLLRYLVPISELRHLPLDPTLIIYLDKLNYLNENRLSPAIVSTKETQYQVSCKNALFWLKECFATCVGAGYRDYCLGWPKLAGDDFVTAIKEKDDVALLVLMYWGVLVDQLSSDYWWAKNFGKSLIQEISDLVSSENNSTTRDVISWAQQQVSADTEQNSD